MTSNISRYALWIVLAYAVWLNYQAWNKDYTAVDSAAAVAARSAFGSQTPEIPQSANGSAPAGDRTVDGQVLGLSHQGSPCASLYQ